MCKRLDGSLVYAPAELSTLRRLTPGTWALSLGHMARKQPSEEDVLLAALFRAGDRLDKRIEQERLERERPKAKKKTKKKKKAKKKKAKKAK